jgi:hypothetical protein
MSNSESFLSDDDKFFITDFLKVYQKIVILVIVKIIKYNNRYSFEIYLSNHILFTKLNF